MLIAAALDEEEAEDAVPDYQRAISTSQSVEFLFTSAAVNLSSSQISIPNSSALLSLPPESSPDTTAMRIKMKVSHF